MRPNFSLLLSVDGIRLLHRSATGWHSVGTADVQSGALAAELEMLRETASRLEPKGIRCALVLPVDQIKLMRIETPNAEMPARLDAARRALEGATPYPVDALAIDISADGDGTYIAAVAVETLDEAAAFAVQHGFNPVCFSAHVEDPAHAWEPDFGPTAFARATTDYATPKSNDTAPAGLSDTTAEPATFASRRKAIPDAGDSVPPEVPPTAGGPQTDDTKARDAQKSGLTRPAARPSKSRAGAIGLAVAVFAAFAGGAVMLGWVPGMPGSTQSDNVAQSQPEAQFAAPPSPAAPIATPETATPPEAVTITARLTDEDAAVLDALGAPVLPTPQERAPQSEIETLPAPSTLTVSTRAPVVPTAPSVVAIEDLYVPAIDSRDNAFDAVALPSLAALETDRAFVAPASPAPAGTQFDLDAEGLVIATPQGALTPDGALVIAGQPPQVPPPLVREAPEEDTANVLRQVALGQLRPRERPSDLVETAERASLDGRTRSELAALRPRIRPASAQETAASASAASLVPLDTLSAPAGTAQAVATSQRPDARPGDFGQIVARSQARIATAPVQTARATPRVAAPKIPSSTSTAREATIRNALNLRKVNLIGVYGKPSQRRALVRLSNGRYERVKVGDSIDGGKISAIGDGELRYQKSGRSIVLKMPKS